MPDGPCRDSVSLTNAAGKVVAEHSWVSSEAGSTIKRTPQKPTYFVLPDDNVVGVLQALGGFDVFLEALQV